jgi:hypothetical protein
MSNPFEPLAWFFAGMLAAATALTALALCGSASLGGGGDID